MKENYFTKGNKLAKLFRNHARSRISDLILTINLSKRLKNSNYLPLTSIKVACLMIVLAFNGCKKVEEASEEATPENKIRLQSTISAGPPPVVGNEFTIAVIPDTQFYITTSNNNPPKHYLDFFTAQTQWIVANRAANAQNIVYAIHLGDISENGDLYTTPWYRIDTAMKILDMANMPYGVAVGNHDSGELGPPYADRGKVGSPTTKYNQYFGTAKFTGKAWYGGNYGSNNDSHFDRFTASNIKFIVIYLEYDDLMEDFTAQNNWAYNLLTTYSDHKAIIVTHYLANANTHATAPNTFSNQGLAIYNKIKALPNVLIMLGGHVPGVGYRYDTYNGRTVKSFISDYQVEAEGGGGYMRLMKISPDRDLIQVNTYSPYKDLFKTDANNQFTVPLFRHETSSRTYDFDQDGESELAFFNAGTGATTGMWKVSGVADVNYGGVGDIPIPADYNGDGRTDKAMYNPTSKMFSIIGQTGFAYGNSGDIPVPADYNGDGKADIAVFRPANGTWYVRNGSTSVWGVSGDIPIPGDYDGDGKVQPAVYRPTDRTFYRSGMPAVTHGNLWDMPVVGDYNGDGITEIVLYRPYKSANPSATDAGYWYNWNTGTAIKWGGLAGDIPAPADYDGDGDVDIAYYRAGTLYVYGGTNVTLGSGADKIINLPYAIKRVFFP